MIRCDNFVLAEERIACYYYRASVAPGSSCLFFCPPQAQRRRSAQSIAATALKIHTANASVEGLYRDSAPLMNDLRAGRLDFVFMDSATALALVREGRLKALAVSTPTRSSAFPGVPTMAEAGFPAIDRIAWFGAVLPAQTPKSISDQLNGWLQEILGNEHTKTFFQLAGAEVFPGFPEDLSRLQMDEIAKWEVLVKLANMQAQ